MLFLVFFKPFVLFESVNFNFYNILVTPTHILPDWFLLFGYGVLRTFENKLFGVFMLIIANLYFLFNYLYFLNCGRFVVFTSLLFPLFVCFFILITILASFPPYSFVSNIILSVIILLALLYISLLCYICLYFMYFCISLVISLLTIFLLHIVYFCPAGSVVFTIFVCCYAYLLTGYSFQFIVAGILFVAIPCMFMYPLEFLCIFVFLALYAYVMCNYGQEFQYDDPLFSPDLVHYFPYYISPKK